MRLRAAVYKRKNKYYIHSLSKTKSGFWILTDPVFELEEDNDKSNIGEKIEEALCSSKQLVPDPPAEENLFEKVLNIANVKNWNTFAKQALCVDVKKEGKEFTFFSMKNFGGKEGYKRLKENVIILNDNSHALIGQALLDAIKNSE